MISIDIPTLLLLVSITFILQAVTLTTFYFLVKEYRGVGLFAAGNTLFAGGFSLVLLRNLLPETDLLGLAAAMLVPGTALTASGLAQFGERPVPWRWLAATSALSILGTIYFSWVRPDSELWTAMLAIGIGAMLARSGVELLATTLCSFRVAARLSGMPFLVYALYLAGRAAAALALPRGADPHLAQITTYGLLLVCSSLWTTGFMLMISQRLAGDLRLLARRDFLTHLYNRLAMQEFLEQQIAQALRDGPGFCAAMLDVDHFKSINDCFGHAAGDGVLQHVANLLAANLRTADLAGRWGGEEFLLILGNCALDEAVAAAERLRAAAADQPALAGENLIPYTLSIGLAEFGTHGSTPEKLLHQADMALYQAKQDGRNRVAVATSIDYDALARQAEML